MLIDIMKNLMKTTLVTLGVLSGVSLATATPTLTLADNLGHTVTISDGGLHDSNPLPGAVTWVGSLGSWKLNVTTGVSKPVVGSPWAPELDLNSVDATTRAGGVLTITLSDSGFFQDGVARAIIGGTSAGSVAYKTFVNSTQLTSQAFGQGPFSGTASGLVSASGPYSLSEQVIISQHGAGISSFDANLTVPDSGSTMALLGFGLLAVESLRRKLNR
jgi:hypothetical protein